MLNGKNGKTRLPSQPKIQNQIKMKTTRKNGETRFVPKSKNGCKNSEKISWMMEFLNAEDSHATSSHEPSLEPMPARSADLRKQCLYSLPQGPKLRDLSENQNYKCPVQET